MGIVHKNLSAKDQAAQVARVKRYESGVLRDPVVITPNHTVRQVIHPLEVVTPGHHQLATGKQRLEPALFVFPSPPATTAAVDPREVGRLHRPLLGDVCQQPVEVGAQPGIFPPRPRQAPMLALFAVMPLILARVSSASRR